jgi:hypothetical protein
MSITIAAFEQSADGGKGLARDTRVRNLEASAAETAVENPWKQFNPTKEFRETTAFSTPSHARGHRFESLSQPPEFVQPIRLSQLGLYSLSLKTVP